MDAARARASGDELSGAANVLVPRPARALDTSSRPEAALDERERKYLDMISQFPESPLGHFTLGRYYVEQGRFQEAIAPLERSLADEPEWTAALVALADAKAGAGDKAAAVALLERAAQTPQASHGGMADDIADRLDDLRG